MEREGDRERTAREGGGRERERLQILVLCTCGSGLSGLSKATVFTSDAGA